MANTISIDDLADWIYNELGKNDYVGDAEHSVLTSVADHNYSKLVAPAVLGVALTICISRTPGLQDAIEALAGSEQGGMEEAPSTDS